MSKTDYILRNIGKECLLVPIGEKVGDVDGIIFLNDTARLVFELFQQDHSLEKIAKAVTERFEVSYEQALADVQTFLESIK